MDYELKWFKFVLASKGLGVFTNRVFNIAFLISLSWHLFCMSVVNIIVLPGKYKMRELTSVSFLGPILEKTALEIMLLNKPVAVTTRYYHSLKYTHSFDKKEKLPLKDRDGDEAKEYINAHAERNMDIAPGIPLRKDKEIPKIVKRKRRQDTYLKDLSKLSGPVARREIIYKPSGPELPSWITAGAPFTLELDFSVSAQGEVKEIIPVISSGNPEVDLLGTRYLKSWKFAPLTPGSHEEQKGRIKFIFGADEKGL